MLPAKIKHDSGRKQTGKRSPAHRAWIRLHACSACFTETAIECAHVRRGTDGGIGIKPSDRWCVSLCRDCHRAQHQLGEESFETLCGIDLMATAAEFFRKSPHRSKLQ